MIPVALISFCQLTSAAQMPEDSNGYVNEEYEVRKCAAAAVNALMTALDEEEHTNIIDPADVVATFEFVRQEIQEKSESSASESTNSEVDDTGDIENVDSDGFEVLSANPEEIEVITTDSDEIGDIGKEIEFEILAVLQDEVEGIPSMNSGTDIYEDDDFYGDDEKSESDDEDEEKVNNETNVEKEEFDGEETEDDTNIVWGVVKTSEQTIEGNEDCSCESFTVKLRLSVENPIVNDDQSSESATHQTGSQ